MNILVTGAQGFIGRNLVAELHNRKYKNVYQCDRTTDFVLLEKFCKNADFVFHLAGVNRPKDELDFMRGNHDFLYQVIDLLKKNNNTCPVLLASSIQAGNDTPYGYSKKAAENTIRKYAEETGNQVFIFRLPNVFGKWSRPNYNSVVATFCYNIARDLSIHVNDPDYKMRLTYIDDVINDFMDVLTIKKSGNGHFYEVSKSYDVSLKYITDLLYSFKKSRSDCLIPDMSDNFTKKLYSTYLSYLPKKQFGYDLIINKDARGSFTEFIKTVDRGQVSINKSKPGITKGNHWHHTKNEKFLVVSGSGIIRFRGINSNEVIEYKVNGNDMTVIDVPVGYTHNIENVGSDDLITVMWANETFDPDNPDTYFLEV